MEKKFSEMTYQEQVAFAKKRKAEEAKARKLAAKSNSDSDPMTEAERQEAIDEAWYAKKIDL